MPFGSAAAEPEPLRNRRNSRITEADRLGAGSLKRKCEQNLTAIELLKRLEADGRELTIGLIHDHFFAAALDKVRPGGLILFITSKGTLDKQDGALREYVASQADLLGAIRLPNDAFKRNANTEVTTHIGFLRKRLPGEPPAGPAWKEVTAIRRPFGPALRRIVVSVIG